MDMPILDGLRQPGRGGPSDQDLADAVATTRRLLDEFRRVELGSGVEAEYAGKVIKGTVEALKKIVRDFGEPLSGAGRVTVVPREA